MEWVLARREVHVGMDGLVGAALVEGAPFAGITARPPATVGVPAGLNMGGITALGRHLNLH